MVAIKLPDGSILNMESGVNGFDIAEKISPNLAKAALAVTVNGTPHFPHSSRQKASSRPAASRRPWLTWQARTDKDHSLCSPSRTCRSETESTPPDSATVTVSPGASI